MTTTAAPASSVRSAIAAILLISLAATLFLFWLIYIHPAAATSAQYAFLPALNAVLNGLAATALLIGYTFIRARKIKAAMGWVGTSWWTKPRATTSSGPPRAARCSGFS